MTTKPRQSSSYSDDISRYEFVDYTSVSNFEKFVTMIEETLYSWGIKDGSFGIFSKEHEFTRKETLIMGEEAFQLTYHCQAINVIVSSSKQEQFPLAAQHFYQFGHDLHRWTGQDKILIIKPLKKKIFNAAVDLYQAKQLISACAIAFQNVGCKIPVFVPVGQSRHEMYMGYMVNLNTNDQLNETEVRFNMSLTTPPPPPTTSQLSCLDGLKTLFLQKLCVHYEDYGKTVDIINENFWISAVYTYNLKNWFDENWKNWDELKTSFISDKNQQLLEENQLKFGSFNDPLKSLTLSALFPFSKDNLYMDALTAKKWQISREFTQTNQQKSYLSTLLEQVINSWIKDPKNKEYLAPYDNSNNDSNINLFNDEQQHVNFFKSDQVDDIINTLFQHSIKDSKKLGLRLKTSSSVPYKSFLWNLLFYSLKQATPNATNFLPFLNIIWLKVTRKIRWHWENLIPIPDLNPLLYDSADDYQQINSNALGIDLRYNILHQKISMVNCCIHRKLQNAPQNGNQEHYEKKTKATKFMDGGGSDSVSFEDDEDVFLDAVENESALPMTESFVSLPQLPTTNTIDELEAEAAAIKDDNVTEGELHIHQSLKLLKTGEPMKIPITQDAGFMTEDMITEQAGYFEQLGTSEDATQKRAKLQSAQLYSDMEAFKAANSFACLQDFVRWHSPRDWIINDDDDGDGGHLSTRMSEPNNIWQELWNSSLRIPCSRQKPLFNISTEAEKALYYLETTSVHEFFSIMLPTLGLISYDTLSSHPIVKYSKHVSNGLIRLGKELSEFPWDEFLNGKTTLEKIISIIRQQECITCFAISLLRKLPEQYDLVDQLLYNDQSIVKEGDERSAIFQLFRNDEGIISKPSFREYVLYNDCKDLTTNNRLLPSRQYAIVKDSEIRIIDMQTTDALYY